MINFVVIDLGSNSVRLKVTEIGDQGELSTTHYQKAFVRLSEDMGPDQLLKSKPMARTINTLKTFKAIYSKLPNVILKAVATAAVRQAKNQKAFLKRVKQEVGLEFRVISGLEEADLDYLGVSHTLPIKNGLIIDTGGASTELILAWHGQNRHRISLPFGSVLLSQRFCLNDRIQARDLFAAENVITDALMAIPWLLKARKLPVIALGGSNRTIAKIHRRELTFDKEELPDIHGMYMPTAKIDGLVETLLSMSKEERANVPGLAKIRTDVIVAGLLPIALILRLLQSSEVVFSNHGLRDGLIFKYLAENRKKFDHDA